MLNINYVAFLHKIYVAENTYHLSKIIEIYLKFLLKYWRKTNFGKKG